MKRVVLVTGAGGNLGRAVCKKFIDEGDLVKGLVRKHSVAPASENSGYDEIIIDLLDEEQSQTVIGQIIKDNGRIDIAVLTAGGFAMGKIKSTRTQDINDQFRLNFETAYNVLRPVFTQMMEQGYGRIFLIGSKAGYNTSQAKGVTAYALSKSLLFSLAEILNAESKGTNVVSSVVVPGIIDTPQNRSDMPDADFSHWVAPADIAEIIYFYTSPPADGIREPVIKVYGGL